MAHSLNPVQLGVLASIATLELLGLPVDALGAAELLAHMEASLDTCAGGWIVTANVDILRHFVANPTAKSAYLAASIRVADGMPLVWASRLRGRPLPERVAGSSMCIPIFEMCQRRGFGVCLLGGSEGTAERAAARFEHELPGLKITGRSDLRFSDPPRAEELEAAHAVLASTPHQVVLVGLGSPKQELVIEQIRHRWPESWFIGVGGSFGFLAGDVSRAPKLMQELGLEWVHRMAVDPLRLGPRYLRDIPIGLRLMLDALKGRLGDQSKARARMG